MAVIVNFQNLIIKYEEETLPPITLEVKEGDVVGIESTRDLFDRALADFFLCFSNQFDGKAELFNIDLKDLSDNAVFEIRKCISLMSPSLPLISNLKLIENVYLHRFFYSNEKEADIFKKAYRLLEYLGIEKKFNLNPAFLTNFEKKLGLFARALLGNYKLFYFSRLFSDTDQAKRSFLMEKILEQKRINDKITIIIVERSLDELTELNFNKRIRI